MVFLMPLERRILKWVDSHTPSITLPAARCASYITYILNVSFDQELNG